MPLPNTVPSTATVYDWLAAFNNTVSTVASANAYLLISQNATPVVSSGNASMNGTFTVATVNVTGVLVVNGVSITGAAANATYANTAGTANSALFANLATYQSGGWVNATSGTFSANVAVDTNVLFVDTVNNRVGIGNTTPGTALSVYNGQTTGTAADNIEVGVTSVNRSAIVTLDAAAGQRAVFRTTRAGSERGRLEYVHTTEAWVLQGNGTSEMLRVTSNGDVGIANTAPVAKLHVSGTAWVDSTFTAGLVVSRSATSAGSYVDTTRADADGALIGLFGGRLLTAQTSHQLVGDMRVAATGVTAGQRGGTLTFNTKPDANTTLVERMRITDNGHIGIGTTTPAWTAFGRAVTIHSDTLNSAVELSSNRTDADGTAVGFVSANYRTNSANHNRIAEILFATDGTTANQRGGRVVFYTKADGATTFTEKMRVTANGNVGIANTSPTSTLHVTGTAFVSGTMTVGGTLTATLSGTASAATSMPIGSLLYSRSNTNIQYIGDTGVQAYAVSGGAAAISFHRPLLYAVNFGLDTDNVLKVGGWSMGNVAYAILHAGNYSSYAVPLTGGTMTGQLNVNANAAFDTNVLYVDALNDRVGIGTTTPSSPLHVSGAGGITARLVGTAGNNASLVIYSDGGTVFSAFGNINNHAYVYAAAGQDVRLYANAVESIRLTSAGYLGVGTTTPGLSSAAGRTYLTIQGSTLNGTLEFATRQADAENVATGMIQFTDVNSVAADKRTAIVFSQLEGTTSNNRGGRLVFTTKADNGVLTERMRITQAGLVGIANTAPTSTLHVTGNVFVSTTLTVGANAAFDTNVLFVDTVNDRVGIGNAAPTSKLHVTGNTFISDTLTVAANSQLTGVTVNSGNGVQLTRSTGYKAYVAASQYDGVEILANQIPGVFPVVTPNTSLASASIGIFTYANDSFIGFNTGNTNGAGDTTRMSVSGNGYVGIGTSNPTSLLHVVGSTFIAGALTVSGNAAFDTNVLYVDALNNRAGIGTATPSELLHVSGGNIRNSALAGVGNRAVYSDTNGNLTNSSSDASLKANVVTITSALDLVDRLRGVYHHWKDTARFGAERAIGVIAQEVQPHVPEVVGTNHDGTLSVDYPKLTALLIEAVKELSTRLAILEARQS